MAGTKFSSLLALALVLAACGASSDASDSDADRVGSTTVVVPTTASADDGASAVAPTSPQDAAAVVIEFMNGAELSAAEFDIVFGEDFRTAVPFDDFTSVLTTVVAEGPWTLGPSRESTETSAIYEMTSAAGEVLLMNIAVNDEGITSLLLSPDQVFDVPANVEEALTRLEAIGQVRLAVSDASQGACAPVVDAGLTEVMPLGSAFKLYVLGAVVKAMDDGSIGWDTEIEIRDGLDSLPSGTTQDVEPGTTMTVRTLAELMISISDNTATDHLIDLVGRDAVEAMLTTMGNDAVDRNLPFLTTRELFVLKFGDPDLGARYAAADEGERRSILADEVAPAALPDATTVDLTQPFMVDELEWFASPRAMCDAMVWLVADPVALEVLSINPGVPAVLPTWDTIAFKGGSEPGLITMVWWTSVADGRAFVTAGSVVSSSGPIDEFEAANLFAFVRDHGPAIR